MDTCILLIFQRNTSLFLFFRFTADSRCGDPAEGRTGVARQPQGADPAVRFI